jgi:asparagine synthetase B (glutamine-hydrolysing)
MKDVNTIAATVEAGQGTGPRRAVVLLSGGLDSATAAAWAVSRGLALSALSVDYGQRHRVELDAARDVARALCIADHVVILTNGRVATEGTPEHVRQSTDPLVYQYVHALTDGPVRFHYPGVSVEQDFGAERIA